MYFFSINAAYLPCVFERSYMFEDFKIKCYKEDVHVKGKQKAGTVSV